jgi:chlorite dismutase
MHDPRVPETLDGWSVLHQMYRVQWTGWSRLGSAGRKALGEEAAASFAAMNRPGEAETGLATLLGHKGDLMVLHFRKDFEALQEADLQTSRLGLCEFLEPTASYVSVVELGLYEMTAQIHARLGAKGLKPGSDEFEAAFDSEMEEQRRRVLPRLFQEIPRRRQVCFYPMNKRRGEARNWYAVTVEERGRMMRDHGLIGRKYAGQVTQIISGSIGYDDWEWGVDLFADDPLVFKKLIYEMRFDEASTWYAEFGAFYVGLQFSAAELPRFLCGEVPRLLAQKEPALSRT